MSTIVDKQIVDAEKKLTALLRDVDQEVFARVQAWVVKMANGLKLSEFLYADDQWPVEHRVTVVRSLIDILEAKDYARLPEVEKKDAPKTGAKNRSKISEVGASYDLKTECAALVRDAFQPVDELERQKKEHDERLSRMMAPARGEDDEPDPDDDEETPAPPPPDELRELVRQEVRLQLASILETIAKVLRDSK